jgi:hypothetical protein
LGAGAIALAVVGAVAGAALLLFGGKKGFDYMHTRAAAANEIHDNPLYEEANEMNANPLFEEDN